MKYSKLTIVFIIVAILAVGFFIVKHKAKNSDTINVGAIFSSTGVAGDYGKKSVEGVVLATELINSRGGINGKKINLFVEDAKSSNKDAISAYQKLVDYNGVHYIIGDVYSSTTKVVIENLSKDVVLFAPGASNPDLVNISENFLRNWTSDDFDGFAMSKIIQEHRITTISVLTQQNDYTMALMNAFVKDYKTEGRIVSDEGLFTEDQKSFRELLMNLKRKDVKAIYLIGMSKQVGQILKESKEIGFMPQWFTNLTVNTEDCKQIAGSAINGVIFSEPFVDRTSDNWKEFYDEYKVKFNKEPDTTSAHSFDALNILALAFNNTNYHNIEEVTKYINNLHDYQGVSGNTTFDGKGGVLKDIEVLQFQNDVPVRIKIFRF